MTPDEDSRLEIGGHLWWFAVKGNDGRLPDALWTVAEKLGLEELPLWSRKNGDWLALRFDPEIETDIDHWAASVSRLLGCASVSFFTLPRAFVHSTSKEHHSSWDFKVFSEGNHLGGIEMVNPPIPLLLGDAEEWCKLLGVSVEVPKAYVEQARKFAKTGEPNTFAFEDDPAPAWNADAHFWFAGRAGIMHPFSERALPMGARFEGFTPDPFEAELGDPPERLVHARYFPDDLSSYLRAETVQEQLIIVTLAEDAASEKPALALELLERVSHPSLAHKKQCASLAARKHHQGSASCRMEVLDLARAWLLPASVGAVNQEVSRDRVMSLLENYGDPEAQAVFALVAAADEPEVAMPEGDQL